MPLRRRRRLAHARPISPEERARHLGGRWRRGSWLAAGLVLSLATAAAAVAASQLGGPGAAGPTGRPPGLPAAASAGPTAPLLVATASEPAPSPGISPEPGPTTIGLPTGYRWPLDHARITAAFGPRTGGIFIVDGKGYHDGIDVASFCGDHIEAAHDGIVLVAGRHVDDWIGWVGDVAPYHARLDAKHLWSGRAIMVIVDDGNGYRSVYMHLSLAVVNAGQFVRAGQLLGYEGATGDATGCHLHYSLFDPSGTSVFDTDPALVKRLSLPPGETGRIDPLLVLPPPASADVTWGWGARD